MITRWKVDNFKSISEETELDLGPLTIFAGANSSGKSTFIQSILLIAQTLAHKVGSRSVVLNGAFTSLGQFDDLKSDSGSSDQITIKCICKPITDQDQSTQRQIRSSSRDSIFFMQRSNQLQEISCEISFDANPSSSERDLYQLQPRLFTSRLSCTSRDEDNIDQRADISIHRSSRLISEIEGVETTIEIDDQLRAGLAYSVDIDDNSLSEVKEDFVSAAPIGCILKHFLPKNILYSIDTIKEDANVITQALQDYGPRSLMLRRRRGREILISEEIIAVLSEFLKGVTDLDQIFNAANWQESLFDSDTRTMTISEWYERIRSLPHDERIKVQQVLRDSDDLFERIHKAMKKSVKGKLESRKSIQPNRLPRVINEAGWYLNHFFASSLKYLGPLRDAPKPLYPLAPAADPFDVGLRGEHTASILDLHKNKMIRYVPSKNFKSKEINHSTSIRTLETAVMDWLKYLGVASSVKSRDRGKLGHELKVGLSNSDNFHDLTHVGVGVSQVLPILVMSLLADTDTTLVFEQPELHLHPKVQTLLGDFFLSMALCKKQCIVETHSEYLIDRLRFRMASAPLEHELNDQAKIYFVEKPAQSSKFREVKINEYGAISDWPEGFFDQSQREAEEILRAATKKRKTAREAKDDLSA